MGMYDTEAGIHADRIVNAIGELTEEVRGLRRDIGELKAQLNDQHSEMKTRVAGVGSDICGQIMVWSP